MKIKAKFILLHDGDNDPLIINLDKVLLISTHETNKTSVSFKHEFNSRVMVNEGVTRIQSIINNANISEVNEFLLLHDEDNKHISVHVNEIMDIFALPSNHSKGKSKIFYDETRYVYVKENVNKIYDLLTNVKENTPSKH